MDPKQPEPKKDERVPIKSLRTYQGDVEEAMSKNKYSATTILVAEQKRREEAPVPRVAEKHINLEVRNKFFTILGISLFLIGVLVVTAVYYVRSNEKVEIVKQTKAIIDFVEEKNFPVASSTRDSLISMIVSEKNSFKKPANSVLYINTTSNTETPEKIDKIISLLAPNMLPSLARSLSGEYMIGIFSYDSTDPFIILSTVDYPSSYAGMLKWEKDMVKDLGKLFSITEDTSGVFIDEAIRNKDLRILKDSSNKTLLVYSFIDKNTLVITKNENIFNAILAKYLTSKNVR